MELSDPDYRVAWSTFETKYEFRTWRHGAPGIREPADSVTFDLCPVFDHEGPTFAAAEEAINAETLRAFVSALPDEPLIVLDWQHPAYRFRPRTVRAQSQPDVAHPGVPERRLLRVLHPGLLRRHVRPSLGTVAVRHGCAARGNLGASLRTWLPVLREGGLPLASSG